MGYLHWNTRAWDDIGGAPTYNRANLTRTVNALDLTGGSVNVETVGKWGNIWTTPGSGALDASWRANGEQLKEEISINQAGRDWIVANHPPGTPLAETYFGFVFQLDWSDIPRVLRNGILQDPEGDFADDGLPIELRNAANQLLGFMPVSNAFVRDANGLTIDRKPIRKRFYKDGSDYYLLVGVRCDILNGMAAGMLVFDPDIDLQVPANNRDSIQPSAGNTDEPTNDDTFTMASPGGGGLWLYCGAAWEGITIPAGSTIDDAHVEWRRYISTVSNDFDLVIAFEDVATPEEYSNEFNGISGRTKTTATVA